MNLKFLLIFFSVFIFSNAIFSQEYKKNCFHEDQTYKYDNNKIIIKLSSCSYLNQDDTLYIKAEVTNISKEKFYIFQNFQIKFRKRNDIFDGIIINFGDNFTSNIEINVNMNLLSPDSSFNINIKYPSRELSDKNLANLFQLVFGVGYISDIKEIEKYVLDNEDENFVLEVHSKSIVISSMLLEMFLIRFDLPTLFIYFNNE